MTMITVIICTHNPKPLVLARCLDSLRGQTLPFEKWELLVVDNLSVPALHNSNLNLDWHSNFKIIREQTLGLTAARLRGIRESVGELLVFVDDDNLLSPVYLENALEIYKKYSWIGIYGGSIQGEFEEPPPKILVPYLSALAIDEINQDYWSNIKAWSKACPFGAGMVIQRNAAFHYLETVSNNKMAAQLDRIGSGLGSAGDTHMAYTTLELNFGMGRFSELKMTHIIPAGRLKPDYFLKLKYGLAVSNTYLKHIMGNPPKHPDRICRYICILFLLKMKENLSFKRDKSFACKIKYYEYIGRQTALKSLAAV